MSEAAPAPHCPTCACDPTSQQARERTNQVPPFKIDRWSYLYCIATPPSAHREIVEYIQRHRRQAEGRPRILEFPHTSLVVEHQLVSGYEVPVIVHRPHAPPTVHRRRRRAKVDGP